MILHTNIDTTRRFYGVLGSEVQAGLPEPGLVHGELATYATSRTPREHRKLVCCESGG
ncbi:MAG: hypothetical protein Q7T82_10055 [Armatimonadota bacterium]|nr:hypothetical protein [Armatimonadota bacterium]